MSVLITRTPIPKMPALKKVALSLLPFFAFFLVHYVMTNVYASVCAPLGFQGFIMSFLTTASPVCNCLLTVINYTSTSYNAIITTLITVAIAFSTSLLDQAA